METLLEKIILVVEAEVGVLMDLEQKVALA